MGDRGEESSRGSAGSDGASDLGLEEFVGVAVEDRFPLAVGDDFAVIGAEAGEAWVAQDARDR